MSAAVDSIIRPANRSDEDAIWQIFQAVVSPGDTFAFDPQTSREEALAYWFGPRTLAYAAEIEGAVVGSYILRPNQPGLGDHVANAGYMVSSAARGKGIGRRLGEHSLLEAKRLGYRAMQFNFVVSTNTGAVRLWQNLGFRILGTIPNSYRHARLGFVDAYIMFRDLDDIQL